LLDLDILPDQLCRLWLINPQTMKLGFFTDPSYDRYAILSHTWGDEEINFQELKLVKDNKPDADLVIGKAGYGKIITTCKFTRDHGLDHVWVETCCI
jgi:hypothetical protein